MRYFLNYINKQTNVFLTLNQIYLANFSPKITFINFSFLDNIPFNKFLINTLNNEKVLDLSTSLSTQSQNFKYLFLNIIWNCLFCE